MSATSVPDEPRRGVPVALAVVLMVMVAAAGFAAGWLLRPDPAPAAEEVALELGELIEGPHQVLDQAEDGRAVAALYAEDALAVDGPSGASAQGREGIAGGWQYMFAQGGGFVVDHVLAGEEWAAVVTTWSFTDTEGETRSTPMVLLLEIRDGQIVSELDLYDAASATP
jgi:hypothetical protein